MKISRLFILIGAACAGSLVYKAQHFLTAPGTSSVPGQGLYSSLTGPGSLGQTLRRETEARSAALNGEDVEQDNIPAGRPSRSGNYGNSSQIKGANRNGRIANPSATVDAATADDPILIDAAARNDKDRLEPVSYTHLTLPTIYSV